MKKLKRILRTAIPVILFILIIEWVIFLVKGSEFVVLDPKGWVGVKQRDLIVTALLLMSIIVVPVLFMTLFFSWKYRAGNQKAKYTPKWEHSFIAEALWWGVPFVIVIFLSIITWKSSYELDPYKPLNLPGKPLKVQVIALQWKWLFIYPEQNIASVNYLQIPEKIPIVFEISADAPMNSFWIPRLGGQIYAMPGMKSTLHLIADEKGVFSGSSANLSGTGFSGMCFKVDASSMEDFDSWVSSVRSEGSGLNKFEYEKLAEPSSYNPVATYKLMDPDLFEWIVMKPMRKTAY